MAKIYGLFGSMTGKLADTVMSVRNGEQIARKYQPVVFNPSTPAQVATRAKLKLLSQLSAVFAPVIAMRREGAVSSRNLFTKTNYKEASFADDEATINLTGIKITKSVVSLPGVQATRGTSNALTLALTASDYSLSRVVYVLMERTADEELRYYFSAVQSIPGDNSTFVLETTAFSNRNYVVYAYGVRDNTNAARVAFGNLEVPTAESVAQIVTSRALTESDITLTETRAVLLPAAGTQSKASKADK